MHTRQLFDLNGRVAIVTGGGSGIGRQMAQALAEMGAALAICARDADRCEQAAAELSQLGVAAVGFACDVTDPAAVATMVRRTRAELGRIDVLVNNAGRSWGAPAAEMSPEDWRKVVELNLTGAFLCCQAAGRAMIEQGAGKIVNIASVTALGGAPAEVIDAVGYSASKGGLVALTRDLAWKWAPHGVNVNAIAPGWFPTRMSSWIIENRSEPLLESIPLRRVGGVDDLKGAVVYLASAASDYVTGQVLAVDGGQSA